VAIAVVVIVVALAAIAIGRAMFGPVTSSASAIASKVDPAIVDITTNLAYQNAGGAGTGMVLGPSGLVLTNNHVIEGASSIRVRDVGNGHDYSATVLGTDATHDIAVLQLKGASHLKTVTVGNSATLSMGEAVIAMGNAGGVGGAPSVATGVVEALGSSIVASDAVTGGSEQLTGLIQTNAPLEPGDSGGPLANRSARVIGIDTAGSAGYRFQSGAGAGFAIPIDSALAIAHQIESGLGSTTIHIGPAAFLGVQVVTSPFVSGALVTGVIAGSSADRAGLVDGDVIVALGEQSVDSPTGLTDLMQSHHPGDVVQVGWVDQFGAQHTATVHLTAGPPQ